MTFVTITSFFVLVCLKKLLMTTQTLITNHQLENSVVETSRVLKTPAKELGKNYHNDRFR
ncbi:MAG: hypothetical protein F6K08_29400 [Okeania sp. SIO1H6]|nr:hypothetical protein [Okeania sp. SIO1H6]